MGAAGEQVFSSSAGLGQAPRVFYRGAKVGAIERA
jgi:hypothetical protein